MLSEEIKGPESCITIQDAIALMAMDAKYYFDCERKAIFFRLHKGYSIPSSAILGRKLSQQRMGPFTITKRLGRWAYKLKLPTH